MEKAIAEADSPPQAWDRLGSEKLESYRMFGTRRDRVRSPRDGAEHEFEIVESPDGVTLLAITPDNQLVLVEQFRHGTRELTLETPSGVAEDGESATEAGKRELREETGFAGRNAEILGTLLLNPSWQTTRVNVVLVRDAERAGSQQQDEAEDIRVRLVPLAEVPGMVRDGTIRAAVAVSGLALLWLHQAPGGAGAAGR